MSRCLNETPYAFAKLLNNLISLEDMVINLFVIRHGGAFQERKECWGRPGEPRRLEVTLGWSAFPKRPWEN